MSRCTAECIECAPRSGTVVTIHQDNRLAFTQPITDRLRQRDTGLRSTADASLLVESLIDLGGYMCSTDFGCGANFACVVVDQALEVVEEYQNKILRLERAVLLKPSMKHVRRCMYSLFPLTPLLC